MLSVEWQSATASAGQATGDGVVSLVVAGFCLILGFVFLPFLGRAWRGERAETVQGILSAFGNRIGQALHCLVGFVSPLFLIAGVGLIVDGTRFMTSGALRTQLDMAFNVWAAIIGLMVLICWTIILFNQPKFLVPPHMRYYHGLVGDLIVTAARKVFRRD